MPVLTGAERHSPRYRLIIGVLYLLLGAGAILTVYPFLLMLGHAMTTHLDKDELLVVPRFLTDDTALYHRYLAEKYAPRFVADFNKHFGTAYGSMREVPSPPPLPPAYVQAWRAYREIIARKFLAPAFYGNGERVNVGLTKIRFYEYALKKYGTYAAVNRAYDFHMKENWPLVGPTEMVMERNWYPVQKTFYADWRSFMAGEPRSRFYAVSARGKWITWLRSRSLNSLDSLNTMLGTAYRSFTDIPLPVTAPDAPRVRRHWEAFARTEYPFRFIRFAPAVLPVYQRFMRERYQDITRYNRAYGTAFARFADVTFPKDFEPDRNRLLDWGEFIRIPPLEAIRLQTVEHRWRQHLLQACDSLAGINARFGTSFTSLDHITPPVLQADWKFVQDNRMALRFEYALANYRGIGEMIIAENRSGLVTLVVVVSVILLQLVINPLCAYALSRFKLGYSQKILLFLLGTMAFPAEVVLIPNFLLMKQLGFLNTFWALILPSAANGYFIFILKGFFDNLPRDMFDAADIDGAGELTLLRKIAIPLSKPVLAWMVLNVFTVTYGSFLYAMMVCQDPAMWTIMVEIYNLRMYADTFTLTAAVTVIALPILVVFLVSQGIIMRGMVLPVDE